MAAYGPTVTSIHNQWVKYARSLQRRKMRHQERAFLIEGVRLIADALAAGATPRIVFFNAEGQSERIVELAEAGSRRHARVIPVSAQVMRALTETETPQGIAAIFPFPGMPLATARKAPLFVIADGIHDPGNLGTLLRSALGASANAVFIAPGTVDPFSPKVARAGMGAHFRLPIRPLDWEAPDPLLLACRNRYLTDANADLAYDRADLTASTCLIIGSEAAGLSPAARALSTGAISIPLAGGLESLNAGIAGAVILFEAARQRRERPERRHSG